MRASAQKGRRLGCMENYSQVTDRHISDLTSKHSFHVNVIMEYFDRRQ